MRDHAIGEVSFAPGQTTEIWISGGEAQMLLLRKPAKPRLMVMQVLKSRLTNLGPVREINNASGSESRKPTPMWFSNIPLMWEFLQLVVRDWTREAAPYQSAIDNATTENRRLYHQSHAFFDLQPYYLKCLFSYVMFFCALEDSYIEFFKELKVLNRKLELRVKPDKKPKQSDYIKKIRKIRNISIVHLGSNKGNAIDSAAAMMWQPLTWGAKVGERWDLSRMSFGTMRLATRDPQGKIVSQSVNLEINGISELDQICHEYLDRYDQVCADYLYKIRAKLPITIGNYEFVAFEKTNL